MGFSVGVNRGTPAQASFVALKDQRDVEIQPSFEEIKTAEQEAFEEAQDQLEVQDETIASLNAQIERLKAFEIKANELEELMEQVQEQKSAANITLEELKEELQRTDEQAQSLANQVAELEQDISDKDESISELRHAVETLEETLRLVLAGTGT